MGHANGLDIASTIRLVLFDRGPDVLLDPNQLVRQFGHYMDVNSPEYRILLNACDEEVLAPFVAATSTAGTTDMTKTVVVTSLALTAKRASAVLHAKGLNETTAHFVAEGITAGIARWASSTPDEDERWQKAARLTVPLGTDPYEPLSLAGATWNSILRHGIDILEDSHAFLRQIASYMSPTSKDLCILDRYCDDEMLTPYHKAALEPRDTRNAQAGNLAGLRTDGARGMDTAAMVTEYSLTNVFGLTEEIARAVARGIAEGVSLWTGDTPSWMVPQAAVTTGTPRHEANGATGTPRHEANGVAAAVGGRGFVEPSSTYDLTGANRLQGSAAGIDYELDKRSVHVAPIKGLLRLSNRNGYAVRVTAVVKGRRNERLERTLRSIPGGGAALIAFDRRVTDIDSLTVEPLQTAPSIPAFTWRTLIPDGSGIGFVKLRVRNVSQSQAKLVNLVVLDESGGNALAYREAEKLEPGEGINIEFYSTIGRGYAVYVNGVRVARDTSTDNRSSRSR